jgi:hypothetical protein
MAGTLTLLHGGTFLLAMALIWWRDWSAVLQLWPRGAKGAAA